MSQPHYESHYPARAVRAKTSEVVEYHKDDARPGKPLYLLIPGGLIALVSLALIVWTLYATFVDGSLVSEQATMFLCLLAPVYVGGVFLFSYGYELYDIPKAIRLTAIIVFLTVAAVVILAVFLALIGGGKSSSKSSGSKGSSSSRGGGIGSFLRDTGASSTGGGSYRGASIPPVFLNIEPPQTVTREVVREVPVPVEPPPPQPVVCPFCASAYVPAENNFACPNCGAATPKELLPPETGGTDSPQA